MTSGDLQGPGNLLIFARDSLTIKAEQSFDLRKKRAPARLKGERQGGETRAAEDAEGYENSRAESS